jgi:hypothetical protein
VLIVQANRFQKIIILRRKHQLLHLLMVVQVKMEWLQAQKKENINLEGNKKKMEVNKKVYQIIIETEIKNKEEMDKIKTHHQAQEMESNKNRHQKINKEIKNKKKVEMDLIAKVYQIKRKHHNLMEKALLKIVRIRAKEVKINLQINQEIVKVMEKIRKIVLVVIKADLA